MPEFDWSQLYQHRKHIAERYGELWDLPMEKRYHSVLSTLGDKTTQVLDIGAGDRSLQSRLELIWGGCAYKSCDIDLSYQHDFDHIDQVSGEFDLICMFEIIEHLELEDASRLLQRCFSHLTQGGRIVITTPNIYYQPGYLRDVTHRSAWCYDELAGFLEMIGFKVNSIHRLYHDSLIKRLLRQYVFYPWFRIMHFDFARQIIVVATKE